MKTTLNRIISCETVYDFDMQLSQFHCETLCLVLNSMQNRTQLIARTKWFNHIKQNSAPHDINIIQLQNGVAEYVMKSSNDFTCTIRTVVTKSEIDNVLDFLNLFNTAENIRDLINCKDLSAVTLSDIVYCVFKFKDTLNNIKDMT